MKNKGGAPKKTIDYIQLQKLCAIQCTGEECAALLNIDYDTLNRHLKNDGHGGFTDYFKKYSANGKASLRRRQYKAAVEDGNVPMMIWLGKQYLGQKEPEKAAEQIIETKPIEKIQIEVVGANNND